MLCALRFLRLLPVQNSALSHDVGCIGDRIDRMQMYLLQSLCDDGCADPQLAHVLHALSVENTTNPKGKDHEPGIKSPEYSTQQLRPPSIYDADSSFLQASQDSWCQRNASFYEPHFLRQEPDELSATDELWLLMIVESSGCLPLESPRSHTKDNDPYTEMLLQAK